MGPILAIIFYFRNDLVKYAKGVMRTKGPVAAGKDLDARLGWYTLIGTLPLVIAAVLLQKHIETTFRRLDVIAGSLIVLALVLIWAEMIGKKTRDLSKLTFGESLVIGVAQILALVPGASRSGVTITAGLFQGLDRESAAEFSFLLSIPAITLAGLFNLVKVLKTDHGLGGHAATYLSAMVVALIVAYVIIGWFLKYVKNHTTAVFIGWRIALGLFIIAMLATHQLVNHPPTVG
jgi:undecaprenyl-diphosphatase